MKVNLKSIDFKKYKRVFAFGCSFTEYKWPTWANVLGFEMPAAEFYNFGKTGGGNVYIASMVVAANQKYRFNENDLVMIMWSTHCREDRYIDSYWLTPGNIYTQNYYSDEFVKKFSCAKGYLIRDLAYMTSIKYMLEVLPCDNLVLRSVDASYDRKWFSGYNFQQVVNLYQDVLNDYPPEMYRYVHNGSGGWINGHCYEWPGMEFKNNLFYDYHPNTAMYMDYLMKIGIPISEKTQDYVKTLNEQLLNCKTEPELCAWGKSIFESLPNYHQGVVIL